MAMKVSAVCFMLALLSVAANAEAAEELTYYAGSFDALRGTESSLIGVEYHARGRSVEAKGTRLGDASLITGGLVTGRLGGYVYAGGRLEIPLGTKLSLAPSFAPGVFFRGHGKDLGGAIEFRSGIEAGLRLNDGATVGLGLFHYSNGKLYEINPGSEAIVALYHFPLTMLGP